MARGPLYKDDYRPLFSGHQTFPLRYGWLKKVYDAVAGSQEDLFNKRSVFMAEDSIARFGTGKNMVASMRHWAQRTGIIEEEDDEVRTTAIGDLLFAHGGLDPYMEVASTLWLIHWFLAGTPAKTTWFWVFNHCTSATFRRDDLVAGILKLAATCNWQRVAETTVRRDVECFIRTYVPSAPAGSGTVEDSLESPLTELSLIKLLGRRDDYQFVRGPKPSLTPGVFIIALDQFWNSTNASRTLSFEMVAHEPGCPGRVFLLDETDLADRLAALEDLTGGIFRWSETAGLRQVVRERGLTEAEALHLLSRDYGRAIELEAA
jgi:hypothetical protein